MLKKSFKILRTYLLGIVISLFLVVPLSPFFGNNLTLFSAITTIITVSLVYVEMWKFGKYDALRHEDKFINAVGYMGFFIAFSIVIELMLVILKPASLSAIDLIHTVWFFPFNGFFIDKASTNTVTFVVSVIAAFVTTGISVFAYFMGIKGFSLSDKILTARKNRIDKKAEKHFKEIEEIKEHYRAKKTEENQEETEVSENEEDSQESEDIKEENAVD